MRRTEFKAVENRFKISTWVKQATSFAVVLFTLSSASGKDLPKNSPKAEPEVATPKSELVVSLSDRKLALIRNGEVVKVYAVAVGKATTPSPTGHFKIVNRIARPTYYHKGMIVGPGHGNPLGNRWMGLDLKGYGIHGTNEPGSIGYAASHGCIRMGKRDVEDLFSRVHVGDIVEILAEPPAELAEAFGSQPLARAELKNVVKPMTQEPRAAIADSF